MIILASILCLCSESRQKSTKPYATDAEFAERLWTISADLCKLSTTAAQPTEPNTAI